MELPIQFPSDVDVILEEVARFRALTVEQRYQSIRSLLAGGNMMLARSPKAEFMREYTAEQERLNEVAFQEAVQKYGQSQ